MNEEWRTVPIEGCEDYEISNMGNVRLLPRDVPTRIVNRGRDMITIAHRKGKDIKPSYDGGRPVIRMTLRDKSRKKMSLPLLVLRTFKADECPGDIDKYTAAYIDGDQTNNRLDNLAWVSKAALASTIGKSTTGEAREYLKKYDYHIIKVNNQIVGYFDGTKEAEELFNGYGFNTSASAISRVLSDKKQFFFMFDLEPVSEMEYLRVSMNYPQVNLKMIYDMILEDRRHSRKSSIQNLSPRQVRTKTVVKKEIVYKDKIVYRDKIIKPEKEIVEKIVYVDRQTGEKVRKPRTVDKSVPKPKTVEKKVETVKKPAVPKVSKPVQKKTSKSMFSNPNWEKNYYDDYVDIDTLDMMEPELDEIEEIERELRKPKQIVNDRDRFKEEMMKRLGL